MRTFKIASCIPVASSNDCSESFILSCNLYTYATVRITNNGFFNVITSKSDRMYQCSTDALLDFNSDPNMRNIFRAIAFFKGDITGAEILLSYTVNDNTFNHPTVAICTALFLINTQSIPSISQLKPFIAGKKNDTASLHGQLYGKQNSISLNTQSNENILLPFYLSDYKIIVCKTQIKAEKGKSDYSKTSDDEFMSKLFENISQSKAPNPELYNMLENKYFEDKKNLSKARKKLYKLYKLTKETGLCVLNTIDFENEIFACFTNNQNTDKFIDIFSDIYNEIQGSIPELYICDSSDSAIEVFE